MTVAVYARAFRSRTLIESGTYVGDMVEAQRARFPQVVSIELAPHLYRAARARFKQAQNVTLLQGDSGELMQSLLARLDGPALFWLDGHYSGGITALGSSETPVQRELETILGSALDSVILVDDARCFGTGAYPTLDDVRALVERLRPGWTCVTKDDIIRIHPTVAAGRLR
jgi:predicted O-methyltransferase YrrM